MGKPFKDWGVVNFIQDKVGDLGKEIGDVIAGGESPLKAATDLVFGERGDQLSEGEKKRAIELAMLDQQRYEAELKDRQDARKLYSEDSRLQFIYALGFGCSYIIITMLFLWLGYKWSIEQAEISEFVITLVSTIFGAMSSKVNTITDFLFGSSQGSKSKATTIDKFIDRK